MSAFIIFTVTLTLAYIAYYAFQITRDLYGKKATDKSNEEVFDVTDSHDDNEDAVCVTEEEYASDNNVGGSNQEMHVSVIDNMSQCEEHLEKERMTSAMASEETCKRYAEKLEDANIQSTGATESLDFVDQLVNQKPGAPKIFTIRGNV